MKMDAPCDTNMDVVPKAKMSSATTTTMVLITNTTADMFEVQRDSKWQMAGWHVGSRGTQTRVHGAVTACTKAVQKVRLMGLIGPGPSICQPKG